MQVTLVVGELERELTEDVVGTVTRWPEEQPDRPLADDERALLEELTRLCHGILIDPDSAYAVE